MAKQVQSSEPDHIRKEKRMTFIKQQIPYYVMMLIPVAYFVLICYWPMFGVAIAFQNYKIGDPFISIHSRWAGLKWFKYLINNPNFPRLFRNTIAISGLGVFVSFPLAIIFAILLNEIRRKYLRQLTANVSLLPYFISTVVIVGIMVNFFSLNDGVVNAIIRSLGGTPIDFMGSSKWFRTMFIGSNVWQHTGFNAVVYTAAIAGIDPNLYEAAALDGSTRFKNIFHITLPCILPTIIIMLLLRLGNLMSVGYEKIILMYTPATYETADVFTTYAFRAGLENHKLSLSAAISLFNSICNVIILVTANRMTKRISETSLW